MAYTEILPDEDLDTVAEQISTHIGDLLTDFVDELRLSTSAEPGIGFIPTGDDSLAPNVTPSANSQPVIMAETSPIELGESFAVVRMMEDKIVQIAEQISQNQKIRLAEYLTWTGWHHQIKINGRAVAFARSGWLAKEQRSFQYVGELCKSPIAERIDTAIDWIEQNVKDNPLVRLLVVPAYQVYAFWLTNQVTGDNQLLAVDFPSQLTKLQSNQLFSFPEFIDALRCEPPVSGIIALDIDKNLDIRTSEIQQPIVEFTFAEWRDIPAAELGYPQKNEERFRAVNDWASQRGYVGAFPNFHEADYGNGKVYGTILLTQRAAEWRDIPAAELGYPQKNEERFRAVNDWASQRGYVGAFPNFHEAEYDNEKVYGTILLKQGAAEWRDIPAAELGYPKTNEDRFRAVNDWAGKRGYLSAFPNFHEADYGNGVVYGTILLNLVATELR